MSIIDSGGVALCETTNPTTPHPIGIVRGLGSPIVGFAQLISKDISKCYVCRCLQEILLDVKLWCGENLSRFSHDLTQNVDPEFL